MQGSISGGCRALFAAVCGRRAVAGVVFDAGPVKIAHPGEFAVDAGRPVDVACAELKSPFSRWYCSTPAKMTVSVADDREGKVNRRMVFSRDELPPAFAGESLWVDWPKAKARYWFFRFEAGGTRAIVRSGQYVNWSGFRVRSLWGGRTTRTASSRT